MTQLCRCSKGAVVHATFSVIFFSPVCGWFGSLFNIYFFVCFCLLWTPLILAPLLCSLFSASFFWGYPTLLALSLAVILAWSNFKYPSSFNITEVGYQNVYDGHANFVFIFFVNQTFFVSKFFPFKFCSFFLSIFLLCFISSLLKVVFYVGVRFLTKIDRPREWLSRAIFLCREREQYISTHIH